MNSPQVFIREDAVEDPDSVYDRQSDSPVLLKKAFQGSASDAVQFSQVPSVAGQAMEMVAAMDRRADAATGVTEASGAAELDEQGNVSGHSVDDSG